MRSLLITLTAGTAALLLSGCPDIPGSAVPGHSDSHWKAVHSTRAPLEDATGPSREHAAPAAAGHHKVGEIAWFQGSLEEGFSRRTSHQSHPLFRY